MSQPLPLREQLKALENLQELDLKIDALKKKKASIPGALKTLEEALARSRSAVEAKNKELEEIEKGQRQSRAAVELNNDRLTRANAKLENVANGQEFNAANKEIEQLKKLNLSLEEQMKKATADAEAINRDLAALGEKATQAQSELDQQAGKFSSEGGQVDQEILTLGAQRAQYTAQVEKRILAVYDRVRTAKGGLGIVPAVGGRCKGCNMMLPPQQFNDVQRGTSPQTCPTCHRLLFLPMATEKATT
jgi:predicted  nucleic acid-binding Zn-ribbon protein